MAQHDLIEDYLQRLRDRLGRGAATDDAVAEVSDHLHEAMAAEVARGLTPEAAALTVVQRFGPADQVARRLRESRATLPARWRRPTGAIGLAAAVLLAGSTFAAIYLAVRSGSFSPNALAFRAILLASGYCALLFFLLRQTARLSGLRRALAASLLIVPAALHVLIAVSAFLLQYSLVPFGDGPFGFALPALQALLLAAGLAIAVPPWSKGIDDARWARWVFTLGVVALPAASAFVNALTLPEAWGPNGGVIPLVSWTNVLLPLPIIVGLVGLSRPLVRSASSKVRTATT